MECCMGVERDCFDGIKVNLTEEEWKEWLTPEQFNVLRKGGTEPPFDNAYNANKAAGG